MVDKIVDTKKKGAAKATPNYLMSLVGARGFEPPTSCSQSRRAARLRHAPIMIDRFLYHALFIRASYNY